MKRNKRTEIMGHQELTSLTELILAQMGDEGADIRKRLKELYRRRSLNNLLVFRKPRDKTARSPEVDEHPGACGKIRFSAD
jgi:hypothetical protein